LLQLSSRAFYLSARRFLGAPFFSRLNFSAEPFLLNLFAAIFFALMVSVTDFSWWLIFVCRFSVFAIGQ